MHTPNYPGPSSHDPYVYHPSRMAAYGPGGPSYYHTYSHPDSYDPRNQRSPRQGDLRSNPNLPSFVGNHFNGTMAHRLYELPHYQPSPYPHDASSLPSEQLYRNLPSKSTSASYPTHRTYNETEPFTNISTEKAPLSHTQDLNTFSQPSSSAINQNRRYTNSTNPHGHTQSPPNSRLPLEFTKDDNLPNDSSTSDFQSSWIISLSRPSNPSDAYAIIISPRANPPPNIVHGAVAAPIPALPTRSLSPLKTQKKMHVRESLKAPNDVDADSTLSTVFTDPHSSSATDSTHADSAANDTSVPDSPQSSHTSVSTSPKSALQSFTETTSPLPSTETVSRGLQEPSDDAKSNTATSAPVKKSWAALLRQDGSSDTTKSTLPKSSVVGFSIPASESQSSLPTPSVLPGKKVELKALLVKGPVGSSWIPQIRPRGLVNTGNICFANVVLQSLVYCTPFYRLFTELGKYIDTPPSTHESSTPLVEATIAFLKEFKFVEGESDDWLDSFIPTYLYEALNDNKRFDSMRVCNLNIVIIFPLMISVTVFRRWSSGGCRGVLWFLLKYIGG